MKRLIATACCIAYFAPLSAMAETTGTLFRECMDFPRKQLEFKYCLGYMAGVHDIMNIKRDNLGCGKTNLPSVENSTLVQQFIAWAKKHPDRWDEPGYMGIIATIDANYPCPNEGYDYELEDPSR